MKINLLILIFVISLFSDTGSKTSKITTPKDIPSEPTKCEVIADTIKHKYPYGDNTWERTIILPTVGKFVEESHYVTTNDSFDSGSWPNSKDQLIENHLKTSFAIYQGYDPEIAFDNLYSKSWQKQWTPEEGGHFGQGSIGNSQLDELSPEMEMWFLTMMWDKGHKPESGTKFLLSAQ